MAKWISVKKSVPHFSPGKWRKVLVTLEDFNGKRFVTTAEYNETHHFWCDFPHSRFSKFRVVAWMEKPKCYEGE